MTLQGILFDLDNTLYPESSDMHSAMSENITAYVRDYLKVDWDEAQNLRILGLGQYGTTLKWLEVEKGLTDIDGYLETIHPQNVDALLPPADGLREMLDNIPLPKYIFTNSIAAHARRVLNHLRVDTCFKRVFDISYHEMEGKPASSAYMRVLKELSREPGKMLFIDDVPAYLQGFRDLGGHCLLVDELNRKENSGFDRISSIQELPSYLTEKFPAELSQQ